MVKHLLRTRSNVALYVWDYFYIANVPCRGDEKHWSAIERATCRIRESEPYLDAPTPVDVRLRNARRVRNAARLALRHIKELSEAPESWVTNQLSELEAFTDKLIQELRDQVNWVVLD